MRRAIGMALVGLAMGCSGGDGLQGPRGAAGPEARLAGPSGKVTDCTVGERFCDGSVIWACSRSGLDADHERDCAAGTSAVNPGTCTADARCPGGTAPCCTSTLPTCGWALSLPFASAGEVYSSEWDAAESCTYSETKTVYSTRPLPAPAAGATAYVPPHLLTAPRCPGKTFVVQWKKTYDGCPRSYSYVELSLERALVAPGTIALAPGGVPGVALRLQRLVQGTNGLYAEDPATSCASWTGTVSWISDVPSWRVTINATCAEIAESGTVLVATFDGDVP